MHHLSVNAQRDDSLAVLEPTQLDDVSCDPRWSAIYQGSDHFIGAFRDHEGTIWSLERTSRNAAPSMLNMGTERDMERFVSDMMLFATNGLVSVDDIDDPVLCA